MYENYSSLDRYFNSSSENIDPTDLYISLVVYANQFYNYYRSGDYDIEFKKEMEAKASSYKLKFIADCKEKIIEDHFDRYFDDYERRKKFKLACKEIKSNDWEKFFLVLDWVKNNWDWWGGGKHYFECFMEFSEKVNIMIHGNYFCQYAKELGGYLYLTNKMDMHAFAEGNFKNQKNPISNFIDWE